MNLGKSSYLFEPPFAHMEGEYDNAFVSELLEYSNGTLDTNTFCTPDTTQIEGIIVIANNGYYSIAPVEHIKE